MRRIKPKHSFSKPQLLVFLLVFGLIGILIWKSFAAPNPSLPGDLNNDDTVNITDMSILLSNYGTTNSTADINGDGTVNILDLSILLSHYGEIALSISADNTVISGTNGQIVDANHHVWTITTASQVAVDGVADTTTGNVTTLAYEAGKIWQKNTSNLWWYKILPTDSWQPSAGTSVSPIPGSQTGSSYLRGVNLSTFGYMASAPTSYEMIDSLASLQYLKSQGVDLVRIPLPWGRLQPTLGGSLDNVYTPKLQTLVSRCATAGIKVILDQHSNGGWSASGGDRYGAGDYTAAFGSNPGGGKTPISSAQFVSFWTQLDNLFRNDPTVLGYDLVNEPFSNGPAGDVISKATYQSYQQAAVTALRNQGSQKQIWIEGMNSSQPQGWAANNGAPWITDPANNVVYSMHTYPTSDTNGNSEYTASDSNTANYLARIDEFEAWRAQYGVKASVGETGWPSQQKGAPNTWQQYNSLADQWLTKADTYGYTVTFWQANAAQEEGFDIFTANPPSFTNPTATISVSRTQYQVIKNHLSK